MTRVSEGVGDIGSGGMMVGDRSKTWGKIIAQLRGRERNIRS